MAYLEIKQKELQTASKLEKFDILVEIMQLCLEGRDQRIFSFYEKFMTAWHEYLAYDKYPDKKLKKQLTLAMKILFKYIQKLSNSTYFKKYYPYFQENSDYLENDINLAELYQTFGYLYWLQQDTKKAIIYLQRSLEVINGCDNIQAIPARYTNLGYLYEYSGDYETAEKIYRRGMEFARINNNMEALRLAYAALGRLHMSRHNYPKAIEFFKATASLYEADLQNMNYLTVLCNLATSYAQNKQPQKAIREFQKVLTDELKKQNPEFYFSTLANLSINLINLEKYEQAETALTDAFSFAQKNGAVEMKFGCYINRGLLYSRRQKLEAAAASYKKAAQIAEKTDNQKQQTVAYRSLADIYQKEQDFKQAIKYLEKTRNLASQQKNLKVLTAVCKALAKCYEAEGDLAQAYKYLNEHLQSKQDYEEVQQKQAVELNSEDIISTGRSHRILFKKSVSFIPDEMASKIGGALIGSSNKMQKVVQEAYLASTNSKSSVLLCGESGTGKELIANLIHFSSNRHKGPFITVNSATFNSSVVQSALFGHTKGAFTGASNKRVGYFEAANKGTIFLDEISQMPLDIQAQLLRVLEQKSVKPLGTHKKIKVDFRLISASNQDIFKLVKQDKMRLDFVNRINTLSIKIPPLRQRREDIPLLIDHFLDEISNRLQNKRPEISRRAVNLLCEYDYPGNIRQLINMLEKLILFCKDNSIEEEDVLLLEPETRKQNIDLKRVNFNLWENEKKLILAAMKKSNNVKTEAAKLLGISPFALRRRLKKIEEL
jgi:transcriptional regulator with PAS, ATPase and Fis domain